MTECHVDNLLITHELMLKNKLEKILPLHTNTHEPPHYASTFITTISYRESISQFIMIGMPL